MGCGASKKDTTKVYAAEGDGGDGGSKGGIVGDAQRQSGILDEQGEGGTRNSTSSMVEEVVTSKQDFAQAAMAAITRVIQTVSALFEFVEKEKRGAQEELEDERRKEILAMLSKKMNRKHPILESKDKQKKNLTTMNAQVIGDLIIIECHLPGQEDKPLKMPFTQLCWENNAPTTLKQDVDVLVKQAAEFSSKQILHAMSDYDPGPQDFTSSGIDPNDPNITPEQLVQSQQGKYLNIRQHEYVEPMYKSDHWWYCRKLETEEEGWAPANILEELGVVHTDFENREPPLLNVKIDQIVSVLMRHYSGWCFCRTTSEPWDQGWVPDAYLKPHGSKDSSAMQPFIQKVKKLKVIQESLQKIVETGKSAEQNVVYLLQTPDLDKTIKLDLTTEAGQMLALQEEVGTKMMEQLSSVIEHLTSEVRSICDSLYGSQDYTPEPSKARVEWLWELEEGQLECTVGEILAIIQQNVEDCGWSFAQRVSLKEGKEDEDGWVPEDALNYNYENEPLVNIEKSIGVNNKNMDDSKRYIAPSELPKWIYKNSSCLWWSNSQNKYCEVSITSIDDDKQLITCNFKVNPESWKAVRFVDVLGDRAARCPLQPEPEKDEEDTAVDDLIGDLAADLKNMSTTGSEMETILEETESESDGPPSNSHPPSSPMFGIRPGMTSNKTSPSGLVSADKDDKSVIMGPGSPTMMSPADMCKAHIESLSPNVIAPKFENMGLSEIDTKKLEEMKKKEFQEKSALPTDKLARKQASAEIITLSGSPLKKLALTKSDTRILPVKDRKDLDDLLLKSPGIINLVDAPSSLVVGTTTSTSSPSAKVKTISDQELSEMTQIRTATVLVDEKNKVLVADTSPGNSGKVNQAIIDAGGRTPLILADEVLNLFGADLLDGETTPGGGTTPKATPSGRGDTTPIFKLSYVYTEGIELKDVPLNKDAAIKDTVGGSPSRRITADAACEADGTPKKIDMSNSKIQVKAILETLPNQSGKERVRGNEDGKEKVRVRGNEDGEIAFIKEISPNSIMKSPQKRTSVAARRLAALASSESPIKPIDNFVAIDIVIKPETGEVLGYMPHGRSSPRSKEPEQTTTIAKSLEPGASVIAGASVTEEVQGQAINATPTKADRKAARKAKKEKEQHMAAVKLQCLIRRWMARFQVMKRRKALKTAHANIIKAKIKSHVRMYKLWKSMYSNAATQIQKIVRGRRGRAKALKLKHDIETAKLKKLQAELQKKHKEREQDIISKLQQFDDALDFNEITKGLRAGDEAQDKLQENLVDGLEEALSPKSGSADSGTMVFGERTPSPTKKAGLMKSPSGRMAGRMNSKDSRMAGRINSKDSSRQNSKDAAAFERQESAKKMKLSSELVLLENLASPHRHKLYNKHSDSPKSVGKGRPIIMGSPFEKIQTGSSMKLVSKRKLNKGKTFVLYGKTESFKQKERELFQEALQGRLVTLTEQLDYEYTIAKETLEKRKAEREHKMSVAQKDTGLMLKTLNTEMQKFESEFQNYRHYKVQALELQNTRMMALMDLSELFETIPANVLHLELKNIAAIEKYRTQLVHSTNMILRKQVIENGDVERNLQCVAQWVSSLVQEGEWPITFQDRQKRNQQFRDKMVELLSALMEKIELCQNLKRNEEMLAEEQGWDEDAQTIGMTKAQKKDRAAFIAQQNFQKQQKIDKDYDERASRLVQITERELNKIYSEQMNRLTTLFEFHFSKFQETFSDLREVVNEIDLVEREERKVRGNEIDNKIDELEQELKKRHEVNRDIAHCAILIQIEKEKLEKLLGTTPGQQQTTDDKKARKLTAGQEKAIFKGLRIARTLKRTLKDLDVDMTAKEKVSILTYSLRMIEARLKQKLVNEGKKDPHEDEDNDFNDLVKNIDTEEVSKEVQRKRNDWINKEADFEKKVDKERNKLMEKESKKLEKHVTLLMNRRKREADAIYRPKFKVFCVLPQLWRAKIQKTAEALRFVSIGRDIGDVLVLEAERFALRLKHRYMPDSKALEDILEALKDQKKKALTASMEADVFSVSEVTAEAYAKLQKDLGTTLSQNVNTYREYLDHHLRCDGEEELAPSSEEEGGGVVGMPAPPLPPQDSDDANSPHAKGEGSAKKKSPKKKPKAAPPKDPKEGPPDPYAYEEAPKKTKAELPKFNPKMLKKKPKKPEEGPPRIEKPALPNFDMPGINPFSANATNAEARASDEEQEEKKKKPKKKKAPNLVLNELDKGLADLDTFVKGQQKGGAPRKVARQAMPPTPMYKA